MLRVAKKIICSEEDHMELLKIVRSKKANSAWFGERGWFLAALQANP